MENETPTILFGNSKWIWTADAEKQNTTVIFRRTFSFGQEKPPARALCRIACESHYYMFVNGTAVVWEGGLTRSPHTGYYDEIDIAKYLVKGDNAIVFRCRYYGNSGRDAVSARRAGLIFECHDLKIYSDGKFMAYESTAYKTARPTNCCYVGHGVNYDASLEGQIQNVLDPAFNSSLFKPAEEIEAYPDEVMGQLVKNPLPLLGFSQQPVIGKAKKTTDQFNGDTYTVTFPREMRVTPYMEITGNGQETVRISTDRTECMGCFGDEASTYTAHSVEYVTKPTVNVYDGMLPMTGTKLIFSMPRTVKVLKLGYREIFYDAELTTELDAGDDKLHRLFDKAVHTLHCCMGSTLMDNPERDRTMWLGDASIEARALFLSFGDSAAIVKKLLTDVLDFGDDCTLYSGVPGNIPVDIPSHGLLALGERGLFAQYINFTGDTDLIRPHFSRLCDYLLLWDMTEHGVALRDGARRWYDNLYNIDEELLENALYYSACKFMLSLGALLGEHDYDEEFEDRMANVADYIESCWDGLGYTGLGDCYDDRANAFVALAGLVPEERREAVARLLSACLGASPYMEWAAIEALAVLGRRDLARKRFDTRYETEASDDSSTMGEDFNGFGTGCQGYQSAVIFEILQIFGGIEVKKGASDITVTPDFRAIGDFETSLKLLTGDLSVRYKYSSARVDIIIDNRTTAKLELVIEPENFDYPVDRRRIVLNRGKNKFTI